MTTMLFSAQNSWLRYFTELSSNSSIQNSDSNSSNSRHGEGEGEGEGESQFDFERVLQKTIAEYGATRDHLELLEKKLVKMLDIKEARMKSEYESARRRLLASERENKLVREIILSGTTTPIPRMGDGSHESDEDDTIKGREEKLDTADIDLPNLDTIVGKYFFHFLNLFIQTLINY